MLDYTSPLVASALITLLSALVIWLATAPRKVRHLPAGRIWKIWEHKGWGDNIFLSRIEKPYSVIGLTTPTPENGDILHMKMVSGRVGAFQMVNISQPGDPSDMWFADLSWIGYADPDPEAAP